MTVVDVNTGKFTGSGGNLEETVTKNNLEAAEEIVRQLRLRDIGGIIVVDFIDMVLESNRDLVLRRLVECLGRDRTRHQVAEVTSLGLVQMTRKRIGTGLLEAFSETCDHCHGRGVVIQDAPVEPRAVRRRPAGRRRSAAAAAAAGDNGNGNGAAADGQRRASRSPRDVAAMARRRERRAPGGRRGSRRGRRRPRRPAGRAPPSRRGSRSSRPRRTQTPAEQAPAEQPAAEEPRADAARAPRQPEAPDGPAPEPRARAGAGRGTRRRSTSKVVTRTRRRAASRPAGPPVGRRTSSRCRSAPWTLPGRATVTRTDDGHHVEHVPIKKKGTRKR